MLDSDSQLDFDFKTTVYLLVLTFAHVNIYGIGIFTMHLASSTINNGYECHIYFFRD